ncbi:hypothetical protein [Streptomyces sp. NBC_00873]|uniref:8-oxoguanine DNA glycosylase OGG fold protein n=1 Tax=Streptomyces sp. NBC_00873 TaxID=2975852 RepID=UPI00386BFC4E
MRFRPETWRPWLEPHGAGHVPDAGKECASGPSGDRLISRDDLTAIRERAGDDPDGLRDLFVAVMIWGRAVGAVAVFGHPRLKDGAADGVHSGTVARALPTRQVKRRSKRPRSCRRTSA